MLTSRLFLDPAVKVSPLGIVDPILWMSQSTTISRKGTFDLENLDTGVESVGSKAHIVT